MCMVWSSVEAEWLVFSLLRSLSVCLVASALFPVLSV